MIVWSLNQDRARFWILRHFHKGEFVVAQDMFVDEICMTQTIWTQFLFLHHTQTLNFHLYLAKISTELMALPPHASMSLSMFRLFALLRPKIPSFANRSRESGSMPF